MPKMRAVQVSRPGGPLELVEREIPKPQPGQVRIKVQACGICHSDTFVKNGAFPNIEYPRIPGHEVAGIVDAVGPGVTRWQVGDRVGVGWHGDHCSVCDQCRRGNFFACLTSPKVTGISFDGGYAEYMIAPEVVCAAIPKELSPSEAAPLVCAGVTTFNALRNTDAVAGDLVAVLGLGGLGHLAVQFAAKMGFRTVGIARGKDKEALARKLGVNYYIDSQTADPAQQLQKLGGAKVILSTVTDSATVAAAQLGLGVQGTLILIGVTDPFLIQPLFLLDRNRSIKGWNSGTGIDSQDTLNFCAQAGVRSMNEIYPLERVAEAYERMLSGKARFRVVLTME